MQLSTNNKITVVPLVIMAIVTVLAVYSAMSKPVVSTDNSQAVNTYNAGLRAGKMEILADLVECKDSTDPKVIKAYEESTKELQAFGELDSTPADCN